MNRFSFIFTMSIFASVLILLTGCDIHTSKPQALHAKRNSEMRRLLVALEMFRDKSGGLPASLDALQKNDIAVQDINIQSYEYRSEGVTVADGTRWLLTTPDPKDSAKLIVGRLPVEVAVKEPKQQ